MNTLTDPLHPDMALYDGEPITPALPACEHIAGTERFIRKAFQLRETLPYTFDITCDLEDGAAAGREWDHANLVASLIQELHRGNAEEQGRIGVRVHDPQHPAWEPDLRTVVERVGNALSYITIPKVHTRQEVDRIADLLEQLRAAFGIREEIRLHVLIETHLGLRNVWDIAAHPLVEVLDFGIMDFISAHHGAIPSSCMRSPGQFTHALVQRAKTEIVAAALANEAVPAHNVTIEFKNSELVHADAAEARNTFGFLRMWSIHPDQIAPIVEALSPPAAELETAARVLLAGHRAHWAPVEIEGILYDRASYRYFWEALKRGRRQGLTIASEAAALFF